MTAGAAAFGATLALPSGGELGCAAGGARPDDAECAIPAAGTGGAAPVRRATDVVSSSMIVSPSSVSSVKSSNSLGSSSSSGTPRCGGALCCGGGTCRALSVDPRFSIAKFSIPSSSSVGFCITAEVSRTSARRTPTQRGACALDDSTASKHALFLGLVRHDKLGVVERRAANARRDSVQRGMAHRSQLHLGLSSCDKLFFWWSRELHGRDASVHAAGGERRGSALDYPIPTCPACILKRPRR